MEIPKLRLKISVKDYLEGEKSSQVKHEYLDGEVYAMAGTSKSHNRIIGTLYKKSAIICAAVLVNLFSLILRFVS
jgi:Uma2 family endonuclease